MFTRYQPRQGRFWNVALTVVVLLTCLRVWIGPTSLIAPVRAQIPDSGMQRKQLLEEARQTNRLLTEIKQFLTTGTLNVRVEGADNQSRTPIKPAGRRGTPKP